MDDVQRRIIDLSAPLVRFFQWKRLIYNFLAYYVIVGLIFFLVYGWNLELQLTIMVLVIVYSFLKDFLMERQTQRVMKQQKTYLEQKYSQMKLYIPLLDRVGKTVLLKRAALFFTDQWLFLEAFNQRAFSATPKDSIKVPYGKGFTIQKIEIANDQKSIQFHATLMDQDYQFMTCYDTTLLEKINQLIPIKKGD